MNHNVRCFHSKTKALFGIGALNEVGNLAKSAGASRCLLIADPALQALGYIDTVQRSLTDAGLSVAVYTGIEPEPYLDGADNAAAQGREQKADLVIGLGGGSAMDTAKAAAILLTNGGKAEDYLGLNQVPKPGAATIMIPSTAGTGAEVTFTAVFTNRETKAKGGINSPHLFPDYALLDPEITVGMPANVTAATGMDALTHAVESVTSRSATVFTEALALNAVRLIGENLRKAVYHPGDINAREQMLYASFLAGLALADAGVGAAHALAYPLGGFYRIPHGLANAMLIPHVAEFNLPAAEHRFMLVAKALNERANAAAPRRAAAAVPAALRTLCADIGIPATLHEVGVPMADIPKMIEAALKITRPVENNPRFLGYDEAERIYQAAFARP